MFVLRFVFAVMHLIFLKYRFASQSGSAVCAVADGNEYEYESLPTAYMHTFFTHGSLRQEIDFHSERTLRAKGLLCCGLDVELTAAVGTVRTEPREASPTRRTVRPGRGAQKLNEKTTTEQDREGPIQLIVQHE